MPTVAEIMRDWLAYELQSRTGFRWDRNIGRYRSNETGRLVSERAVFRAADGFREHAKSNIDRHTERFLNGDIELADWQQRVAREVKDAHIVSHMAGRGGRRAMTQEDWGQLGGRLQFQYRRLDNFAVEVKVGMLSPAQIRDRASLYGDSAHTAFFDGKTRGKREAEMVEERRVLGNADHCDDCVRWASMGWQPIGSLPEPGQESVCGPRCRCEKEYRGVTE